MHETKQIAEWVTGLTLDKVPDTVVDHAKRFILDNLGCQLAGATLQWSRQYHDVVCRTNAGTHSTVTYYGDRLDPDRNVFVDRVEDLHPTGRPAVGQRPCLAQRAVGHPDQELAGHDGRVL